MYYPVLLILMVTNTYSCKSFTSSMHTLGFEITLGAGIPTHTLYIELPVHPQREPFQFNPEFPQIFPQFVFTKKKCKYMDVVTWVLPNSVKQIEQSLKKSLALASSPFDDSTAAKQSANARTSLYLKWKKVSTAAQTNFFSAIKIIRIFCG